MLWLNKDKERKLAIMQAITPTSKTSLKKQCLFAAKGNLKEARELYDFFAEDLKDLPDCDPVTPTWQENAANTVNGIMGWLKENQGTLVDAYSFVQGIITNKGVLPTMNVVEDAEQALEPINE